MKEPNPRKLTNKGLAAQKLSIIQAIIHGNELIPLPLGDGNEYARDMLGL
jgi:hypothetical protein